MKYITSQDFNGNEWQNKTAALDFHVQNASWCENYEITEECYYKIEVGTIKELWIYGSCDTERESVLTIKTIFLDVNENQLGLKEKILNVGNKIYFLVKFDVEFENVKYIKIIFNLNENMPVKLEIFSISDKKLFEVVEQDYIVSSNFILLGGFGYGDFGWLSFGIAQEGGY